MIGARSVGRAAAGVVMVLAALAVGTWMGARSGAASPPPGSSGDPLVTRSYVTRALGTAFGANGGRVRTLQAGETFAFAPGTQCALLAGSATARAAAPPAPAASSPVSAAALVDLTVGRGLAAQAAVPSDHLLVAARAGAAITAGAQGAVLWLSGPQASAAAVGAP